MNGCFGVDRVLSGGVYLFCSDVVVKGTAFVPSVVLHSLVFGRLAAGRGDVGMIFTGRVYVRAGKCLPSETGASVFVRSVFGVIVSLTSYVQLSVVPIYATVHSSGPVGDVVPFRSGIPVRQDEDFFSVGSYFRADPVVPGYGVNDVRCFKLQAERAFQGRSASAFVLPRGDDRGESVGGLEQVERVVRGAYHPGRGANAFVTPSRRGAFLFFQVEVVSVDDFNQ